MPVPKQWVIAEPWAVRDRTTGRWIVGGTQLEPSILIAGRSPRLFPSERSAKSFLDQWQRGMMWANGDGYVQCRPIPGRDKRVFDVIQLQLVRVP